MITAEIPDAPPVPDATGTGSSVLPRTACEALPSSPVTGFLDASPRIDARILGKA
jgi:hypothetical protein